MSSVANCIAAADVILFLPRCRFWLMISRMADQATAVLFLAGDVMTGRGVDQILRHPGGYELYEPYVQDARQYIQLAESRNGPIPRSVAGVYIWGDALAIPWRTPAEYFPRDQSGNGCDDE